MTKPPERLAAVSIESVRRPRMSWFDDQAVDDDLDGVLFVLFQFDLFGQIVEAAIDPHADIAALARVFKDSLDVFALCVARTTGARICIRVPSGSAMSWSTIWSMRLLLDLLAAFGAMGDTDARPQQAQVIVDLGHGAHGGAGVFGGGLLVDRDGGGQALRS